MKKVISNNNGVSLIEMLISLMLFSVMFVPLVSLFSHAALVATKSKNNLELSYITQLVKNQVNNKNTYNIQGVSNSLPTVDDVEQPDYGVMIFENNSVHTAYKYSATKLAPSGTGHAAFTYSVPIYASDLIYRIEIQKLKDGSADVFVPVKSFYMMRPIPTPIP